MTKSSISIGKDQVIFTIDTMMVWRIFACEAYTPDNSNSSIHFETFFLPTLFLFSFCWQFIFLFHFSRNVRLLASSWFFSFYDGFNYRSQFSFVHINSIFIVSLKIFDLKLNVWQIFTFIHQATRCFQFLCIFRSNKIRNCFY